MQRLLVLLLILISLIPVYYINVWLQRLVRPRKSFAQLLLYILTCFALVFVYTFLLVFLILRLFPATKG